METKAGEFKKTQRPLPDTGQHLGLCYSIIDLGTQEGMFNGSPISSRKIYLTFELPKFRAVFDEKKGPQVMVVGNEYTFSLTEKANFRKMMDSWIGQPVTELKYDNILKLLSRPAMIQVVHEQDKKDPTIKHAKIALKGQGVFKRPAETPFPKTTENEAIFFTLGNLDPAKGPVLDKFKWEQFDKLPKWIQKKIEGCKEWPEVLKKHPRVNQGAAGAIESELGEFQAEEDDSPF